MVKFQSDEKKFISLSRNWDLLAVLVLALLIPLLVSLPLLFLKLPLGLIMVLFAPGYATTAAIFANPKALSSEARIALSFGLSLSVLPVLALLLDVLPWGIRPWPMVLSLSLFTMSMSLIGLLRRLLKGCNVPSLAFPRPTFIWKTLLKAPNRVYFGLVTGLLLYGIVAFGAAQMTPSLSEFYVLNQAGQAENYPREVKQDQAMQVQLGIVNHEGGEANYRIVVQSAGKVLAEKGPVILQKDQHWETPLTYKLSDAGPDQKVEIALFYKGSSVPYRRLNLWVNVIPNS